MDLLCHPTLRGQEQPIPLHKQWFLRLLLGKYIINRLAKLVILGTIACVVGLAVLDPAMLGDKANPFATPLEILPEWYLYPVFQILRVVPNKLLGIALQTLIPLGLMILPFIENVNKFSNPFRRPIAMSVFLFGTFLTIYLGIGACLPIDKSLTLGLF